MRGNKARDLRARRRLSVRFKQAGSQDRSRIGFTEDLSLSGLFIQTTMAYGRGTRLEIEVETEAGPTRIFGRVVWAKRAPLSLARKKRSGMGIELETVPAVLLDLLPAPEPTGL